ncbi:tyrosine/serine/threonine protein phosphatase pps1 [Ascosphaera pollenicola]|nr:tyrosine/serine/threonine protein phosphatase pps1 [Ascosphaera pollenicola]
MDVDTSERSKKRSASDAGLAPSGNAPHKIQALDPDVINKIAAGEIIIAPMHALKELIENSVDAGSTSIEILVKDGGLKLLQITDNGHGIDRNDLPILCERFTTSKLKAFEDLSSIGTYGFRGEALASISHIAHLTVTTKTSSSSCAWKAHYGDGKLVPAKPGQSADPKPTAGRTGTQITVEDLFYNIPTRRRAFRSASEEYAKILDVVGRYAVHCSHVALSCKKHGDAGVSISTSAQLNTVDRIRQIYGGAVATELIEMEVEEEKLGFKASGYVTSANHQSKRTTLLLFINHRAVESTALKRAVEQSYSTFLPKGAHPFAYINVEIEPHRVDVNVHPTKREVGFLNEDEIIEMICFDIRRRLADVDKSRSFQTQTLLPGVGRPFSFGGQTGDKGLSTRTSSLGTKKPYENSLVRTDANARTITSMLPYKSPKDGEEEAAAKGSRYFATNPSYYFEERKERVPINLTSVKNLRAEVKKDMHKGLTEIFASHSYIGLVDESRRIAAIQSGVKLYLVDYGLIFAELFYQLGLRGFGNFGIIKLESSPRLQDLLSLAASAELDEHRQHVREGKLGTTGAADKDEEFDVDTVTARIAEQLIERREMLQNYFSLTISEDGCLETLPLLLKGYIPSLSRLPRFLLRLGPFVDWSDEQACFKTFLMELATFYTPEQLPPSNDKEDLEVSSGNGTPTSSSEHRDYHDIFEDQKWYEHEKTMLKVRRLQLARMMEHALFPAVKTKLIVSEKLLNGIVEVADLKGLYRVFERC